MSRSAALDPIAGRDPVRDPAAPRSSVRCPCVSVWGAAVDHSACGGVRLADDPDLQSEEEQFGMG